MWSQYNETSGCGLGWFCAMATSASTRPSRAGAVPSSMITGTCPRGCSPGSAPAADRSTPSMPRPVVRNGTIPVRSTELRISLTAVS
ncbi:hypothetical protein G6F31_021590 [Rhizopus arrhizus]|nr:hypothetical protein G6F31_021590 [Rhizopus arrhizus]